MGPKQFIMSTLSSIQRLEKSLGRVDHRSFDQRIAGAFKEGKRLLYGSSGKSVLFPSDSTTVGYVEDFLRHDSGVRWFLVRSSYQS
ncbi:MAG: hypothetical protein ABSH35_31870, partial [Isosphaeraceae bacterium]